MPATPGGQSLMHDKAHPGNPYDGHTLAAVLEGTEKLTGYEVEEPMSTRATAVTKRRINAVSSSPVGSAACSVPSSASYDVIASKPPTVT